MVRAEQNGYGRSLTAIIPRRYDRGEDEHREGEGSYVFPLSGETRSAGERRMEQEQRAKLEKLMNGRRCEKNFHCMQDGFKELCKAKFIASGKLVECGSECPSLEEGESCEFRMPFGDTYYCKCPVRKHILKEHNR